MDHAMIPPADSVNTHAITMFHPAPQRTAQNRREAPSSR